MGFYDTLNLPIGNSSRKKEINIKERIHWDTF